MVITSYRFLNNPPPLQLLPFHRIHPHLNLPTSPYPINGVDLSALDKPTLPIHPPKPYPKIQRKPDTQLIHTTYVTVNDMTPVNLTFLSSTNLDVSILTSLTPSTLDYYSSEPLIYYLVKTLPANFWTQWSN